MRLLSAQKPIKQIAGLIVVCVEHVLAGFYIDHTLMNMHSATGLVLHGLGHEGSETTVL